MLGAAEFYQTTAELDAAMASARLRSWGVVIATALAMYLLLFGIVRRASRTLVAQRQELRDRVDELSALLATNARLDATVRRAAARTTALNEQFLKRVAADLHDGPAQDLGFAQMRMQSMAPAGDGGANVTVASSDLAAVRSAVDTAMADLRSISSGMQLPDLETLSAGEVAARAVRDFERKTGAGVAWTLQGEPATTHAAAQDRRLPRAPGAPRERLPACRRHRPARRRRAGTRRDRARGRRQRTWLRRARETRANGGGLAGVRERVAVLGGSVDVHSVPGAGKRSRASGCRRTATEDDDA